MEITHVCPECQGTLGASPHKCACCRAFGLGRAGLHARALAILIAVAVLVGGHALFQPRSKTRPRPRPAVALELIAGAWQGHWTTPEGYLFDARTRFEPRAGGLIEARIRWTLRSSPRAAEQDKLGLSGDELVRGRWDGRSRTLRLEGYALQDPHQILGMDRYRLVLSDDGRVLGGVTLDHGTWRGACSLERVASGR